MPCWSPTDAAIGGRLDAELHSINAGCPPRLGTLRRIGKWYNAFGSGHPTMKNLWLIADCLQKCRRSAKYDERGVDMLLYHFTAVELLDAIREEGLKRGDVPTSASTGRNAVWLTSQRTPHNHGMGDGSEIITVTQSLKTEIPACRDLPTGAVLQTIDQLAVRIAVRIPRGDRHLVKWSLWAPRHLERDWLATLNRAGGGTAIANSWYLYFGVISPAWFVAIDHLRASHSADRQGDPFWGGIDDADSRFVPLTDEARTGSQSRYGSYHVDLREAGLMTTKRCAELLEGFGNFNTIIVRVSDKPGQHVVKAGKRPAVDPVLFLTVATRDQALALDKAAQGVANTSDPILRHTTASELSLGMRPASP